MQNCANELVLIKEYDLFKQMMEKIRFKLNIKINYRNKYFYKENLN